MHDRPDDTGVQANDFIGLMLTTIFACVTNRSQGMLCLYQTRRIYGRP